MINSKKDTKNTNLNQNNLPVTTENLEVSPTDNDLLALEYETAKKYSEDSEKELKNSVLSGEKYNMVLGIAQLNAIRLLKTELLLCHELRNLPKTPGKRTDKEPSVLNNTRSKKEIIKDVYKMSRQQAIDIQKLTPENVDKAIEYANKNNRLVTRSLAIDLAKIEKSKIEMRPPIPFTGIYADDHQDFDPSQEPMNYTTLFSCAGTQSAYLKEHGFIAKVANEWSQERADLYKHLYPKCEMIVGDINKKINEIVEAIREITVKYYSHHSFVLRLVMLANMILKSQRLLCLFQC